MRSSRSSVYFTRTDHSTDWSGRESDVYVASSDIMEREVRSSRSSVYFTRTDHSSDWSGRESDVYVASSDIMERAVRQSVGSVVVRTGEVVRQGTLVCLRRVPCAQGRVSYTQSIS